MLIRHSWSASPEELCYRSEAMSEYREGEVGEHWDRLESEASRVGPEGRTWQGLWFGLSCPQMCCRLGLLLMVPERTLGSEASLREVVHWECAPPHPHFLGTKNSVSLPPHTPAIMIHLTTSQRINSHGPQKPCAKRKLSPCRLASLRCSHRKPCGTLGLSLLPLWSLFP